MRSSIWTRFIGKKIHGIICHQLVFERIINLRRTKVHVSVSILFPGKIHQHPEPNDAWKWEREGIVGGDEGPVGGVAQVVSHGVKVVGEHGEEGQEKEGEVQVEVKGEVEQLREKRSSCMAWRWDDRFKRRFEPMWVWLMCDEDKASNSLQACSDLTHVVLVLVSVRRVTLVHIGHEGVLVVIHFFVAILFVIFCIRRCSLYTTRRWQ